MTPRISVVTASWNAAGTIGRLYQSLRAQRYPLFEWVIADGRSTDGTVDLLRQLGATHSWIRFISEPDGGIYHALNKAIALASGDYYVVAGADDVFEPDALANYSHHVADDKADVVLAKVIRRGRVIGGFHPARAWIGPSQVFTGSHSVGTLFKRSLHARFGQYSRRFPILADALFLKTLLRSRAVEFVDAGFVAGTFAEGGATSGNELQLLAENWQIQMLTEPAPRLQTLLFFGKILTRFGAVTAQLRSARTDAAARSMRSPL